LLNTFAIRLSGKNYIAIYSDIFSLYKSDWQGYQVLLETNTVERNRLRGLVLRNHSEHWFAKEKLL
jgi:hypothetical protein